MVEKRGRMTRSLLDKLGWKPGMSADLWRVPEALEQELGALRCTASGVGVFRIAFARTQSELVEVAEGPAAGYRPGGHLWLCYPKKSGRIASDITRDVGWEPILALGLLGVSQVALDEDWSGLRFRFRSEIATLSRRTPSGRAID